jgi:hypothetical protein
MVLASSPVAHYSGNDFLADDAAEDVNSLAFVLGQGVTQRPPAFKDKVSGLLALLR